MYSTPAREGAEEEGRRAPGVLGPREGRTMFEHSTTSSDDARARTRSHMSNWFEHFEDVNVTF